MKKRHQLPCSEWADRLVLRQDDLLPAERAALQEHLTTCSACAAAFADYQNLITRIRALSRPESTSSIHLLPELLFGEASRENGKHMSKDIVTDKQEVQGEAPESVLTLPGKKSWRQRVMALAAVLLAASLAISFVLLSTGPQIGNAVKGNIFTITRGWTQLVSYHGTGNQTINIGNLSLPTFWGQSLACQGKGELKIDITGPGYLDEGGTDNCAAVPAPVVAPANINLALSSEHIQKIRVTAPASMAWSILLVQETPQPAFSLSSAWMPTAGVGGTTGGPKSLIVSASLPVAPDGHQVPTPRRWAVLIVCVGTGQGSIQLKPDAGKISYPACDGQPLLHIVDYPSPTFVQSIQGNPSSTMVWEAEVLACGSTNSSQCQ